MLLEFLNGNYENMKKILLIFISAFTLNWIWENLHSYLYFLPSGELITQYMLFRATFFDAIFITFLGILFLKVSYFRNRKWYALIFGFVVALIVEKYALATGRWAYNDLMPIIPMLNTGLTPTIQLGLLSFIIFKIVGLNEEKTFQCPECSLHYKERVWMEKCKTWCKEHKSCNLEIINHSLKSK